MCAVNRIAADAESSMTLDVETSQESESPRSAQSRVVPRRNLPKFRPSFVAGGLLVLILNLTNDFNARGAGGVVDALGYMGNARHLSGGESVLAWNRSPYRLAYSIVITPIVAVTDDPVRTFQRVVDFNALLMVLLFTILYLIASRLLPDSSPLVRSGVAVVGASYPAIVIYANTAFSETFLAVVFAAWVLSLMTVTERMAGRLRWSLFGVITYVLYFSHGRFLALLPIGLAVAGFVWWRDRSRDVVWMLPALVVSFILLRIPSAPHSSRGVNNQVSQTLDTVINNPGTVAATVWGQAWMALVASATVPAFAVAIFILSPEIRVRMKARWHQWAAIAAASLGVLVVSSMFMARFVVSRDEFTFLIYERYVSVIMPLVVVLSLIIVIWARGSGLRFERLVLLGAFIVALDVVALMMTRSEYFTRFPFMVNTPSLGLFHTRGLLGLWPTALAAFVVGALAIALVWWRPTLGLAAAVAVAALVAADTGDKVIGPYYDERARQYHLTEVVDAFGEEFDGRIAYDDRIGPTYFLYLYSWLRPDWTIDPINPLTDDLDGRLLLTNTALVGDVENVRLVMLENIADGYGGDGFGLWVPPGDLAASLDDRDWLADEGFTQVDDAYLQQFAAELSVEGIKAVSARPGESLEIQTSVEVAGSVALFNARELGGPVGAFQVGARVWGPDGTEISATRGLLEVGLLPGQAASVTVPIVVPVSTPPGTYRITLTPLVEGHKWFEDGTIEIALEVLD